MLRSLLSAASGMDAQQRSIDVIANNLANINTNGFKRSRANFQDLLYQTLKAPGLNSTSGNVIPSGIEVGHGTKLVSTEKMFTEGSLQPTGNETDVAIEGRGFFRISMPNGQTFYTRDGSFKMDSQGRLVTADGFPLEPNIQVPQNAKDLHIGMDGTVTANLPGQEEPLPLGQIQLSSFINPSGLKSEGRNLYSSTISSGDPLLSNPTENGFGSLKQRSLEGSNVNVVEEMVNMIVGQRAYELNSKVIQTSDQMLQTTNQLR